MEYAVIDIETTGGSPKNEKITEIAIFIHDGHKVTDEFVTLINPEKKIPYYITQLTGIDNEMVARIRQDLLDEIDDVLSTRSDEPRSFRQELRWDLYDETSFIDGGGGW